MKKFYTSIILTAVIIAHISIRFAVADSFTFSSSNYASELQASQTITSQPVSYSGSNVSPATTLFINSVPADHSLLSY